MESGKPSGPTSAKPTPSTDGWPCHNCKTLHPKGVLRQCAACKIAAYCSRECQKAHWKVHKSLCGPQAEDPKFRVRNAISDFTPLIIWDRKLAEDIDQILMAQLELHKFRSRLQSHVVGLFCAAPKVKDSLAYTYLYTKAFGNHPHRRKEVPSYITEALANNAKIFEIERTVMHDHVTRMMALCETTCLASYVEEGKMPGPPEEGRALLRVYWTTREDTTIQSKDCRIVTYQMIQGVKDLEGAKEMREWIRGVQKIDNTSHATWKTFLKALILKFNCEALEIEERRRKLMTNGTA